MIFISKICIAGGECAFRQQACLTFVKSAYRETKTGTETSLFPGFQDLPKSTKYVKDI
jgi:hypothetical protein